LGIIVFVKGQEHTSLVEFSVPLTRRKAPPRITRHEEHPPLGTCPRCGSPLGEPAERRLRLIEDIPETQPEVTEHSIPRHWCAGCKKFVEPPVPDAMPLLRPA